MKIYLSAPISGYNPEERQEYFQQLEDNAQSCGFEVFNPMKNGLPETATYDEHLAFDLEQLADCDAIAVFGDYHNSKGCTLELQYAVKLKIPVLVNPVFNAVTN